MPAFDAVVGWLFRLLTALLVVVAVWMTCQQGKKCLSGNAPFINGAVFSPDLALQLIGKHGKLLSDIIDLFGHLNLLRNLSRDSRFFIPIYLASVVVAILTQIGFPFACAGTPMSHWSLLAVILTVLAASADWRENSFLVKALRLNAASDNVHHRQQQIFLITTRQLAIGKFFSLGVVFGLLAAHSFAANGDWLAKVNSCLSGVAALLMIAGTVRHQLLELGITIAGLSIALLFLILSWS